MPGVPSCVWSLESLQSLHLSSNGLSGPLGHPPSSSPLRDVVLSFNQLTGTIPQALQVSNASLHFH